MKKNAFILIFFLPILSFAQNQYPSTVDFKKITTNNFEIVFPEELTEKAQQTANALENFYAPNTNKLLTKPKPVTLVLYNQSVTSNAYAGLGPRRMGWYITPTQNSSLGITEWFTTLSLHEFAHIIQYSKNNQNFTRLGSFILGDVGLSVLQYSIPDWFYEGDAIYSETIFTESGRGRSSNFSLPVRTILLTDQKFNYSQAYLRSYKRFYPNHYYLGYYMVSHINRNYGTEVWNSVLNRTSMYSYWPFAFSRSLKKYTGSNIRKTYKNTMLELDSLYTQQIENLEITDAEIINNEKKFWQTYFDCEFQNNETIVGLKYDYSTNNLLFTTDLNGNETIISETDAGMISVSGTKVVWARENPDLRWGEQSFSDIVIYDMSTGITNEITSEGKYLSPDINPAGNRIVAVEYTPDLKCSLVILNANNIEIIKKYESPDNDYIRIPSWSEDGSKIVFCNSSIEGQAITILDLTSEKFTEIIPHSWENFSRPVFYKNYILYNSEYSGIGNIYAIDINSGQKYQITSRKFGAYNPKVSPDKTKLIFQDYNEKGYDIAMMNIDESKWTKIDDVKLYKLEYFVSDINKNDVKNLVSSDIYKTNKYEVSDYKEYKNLISIHSWMPMITSDYTASLEVYSKNKLNTLSLTAGVNYNLVSNAANIYGNASYQKYFPIFDVSLMSGNVSRIYDASYFPTEDNPLDSIDIWKETNVGFGTWVPLNFSKGLFYRDLTLGVNTVYKNIKNKDLSYFTDNDLLYENIDGSFAYLNYSVNFNNLKQMALKNVRTRFGQSIEVSYRHSLLSDKWQANQLFAQGDFYFPGVFKNQSLKISLSYEKQVTFDSQSTINQYYFSSKFTNPHGRILGAFDELFKTSIDYKLPLLYPDLALGSLIYFKRIKLLAFYDYFYGSYGNMYGEYQSTGAQLLFDVSFLHLNYEFEIGVQAAYLLPEQKVDFGIIFLSVEL